MARKKKLLMHPAWVLRDQKLMATIRRLNIKGQRNLDKFLTPIAEARGYSPPCFTQSSTRQSKSAGLREEFYGMPALDRRITPKAKWLNLSKENGNSFIRGY